MGFGFGAFGAGSNMIDSFLHPERGYKDAMDQQNKYWQEAQSYEKPYWQHGVDEYNTLHDAEGKLLDPTKLQSDWANSYETSPYAQRMLQMNKGQGLDAASSMGLLGSSGALQNIQQGAGDIVSKDRQQYMEDLMQKYMAGIGIGQNIYGTGAQAGANLASGAMQTGNNMSQLAFGKTNAPGNTLENLIKTGANLYGMTHNPAAAAGGA